MMSNYYQQTKLEVMFNNEFKYKSGRDQKVWRIFPSKKVVSGLKDKLSALIFD
jgi:hypothetical protein